MLKILRYIRRIIKVLLGKDFLVNKNCNIVYERFGSVSCGWVLAVEHINQNSIIYSFGAGEDITFDLAIIEKFGLKVNAFDPTPRSIEWIKAQLPPKAFILNEFGIFDYNGEAIFYPPENPNYISHSLLEKKSTKNKVIKVKVKKLETIMADLGHTNIDVLKMDIEGAEYAVIDNIRHTNIRPNQILVEFHHRFPNIGISKSKSAIRSLREMGYQLFYVSNNGEEYSFLLKD